MCLSKLDKYRKVTHVLVATVAIDKWRDRANFTFCINAVNVKDDGEELIGEAVLSSVQFYGIGLYHLGAVVSYFYRLR